MKKWVIKESNGGYLRINGGLCMFDAKKEAQFIIKSFAEAEGCKPVQVSVEEK